MGEQEKLEREFEEWFKKECGYSSNEPLVFERIHLWARYGYLQACKVRLEEIDRLKKRIEKLDEYCDIAHISTE